MSVLNTSMARLGKVAPPIYRSSILFGSNGSRCLSSTRVWHGWEKSRHRFIDRRFSLDRTVLDVCPPGCGFPRTETVRSRKDNR
eukprot:6588833-Pyramimonas_sp.AAC.1